MADNVLDNLKIKIESDSRVAVSEIDKLADGLTRLKGALSGLKGNAFTEGLSKNIEKLSAAIDSLDTGKLRDASSCMTEAAAASKEMGKAADNASAAAARMSESMDALGSSITETNSAQRSTENATRAVRAASEKTKASVSGLARAFAFLKKHNILANGPLAKFAAGLKRILFYRSIRALIKNIGKGFREGITNMYYWSQEWGTTFAPAMDQLKTATTYLKNGFASMFSPLIEYGIPILDRVIDKFVDMFNTIQELFARMTGAETWTKALKYPVQFAEEADKGTKAAKAMKNVLMGFDKLNVINTPNNSGRASGKEAEDYSSMFKTMEVAIDKAKSLGETLADAFNGWVGKIKAGAIGKKLGACVNNFVEEIKKFFERADINELSRKIAEFINNALSKINFYELAKTLGLILRKLFIAAVTLFKSIGVDKIFAALSDFLVGLIDSISEWFEKPENIIDVTSAIENMFVGAIEGTKFDKIFAALAKLFGNIVLALPNMVLGLGKALSKIIASVLRKVGLGDAADWVETNIADALGKAQEEYAKIQGQTAQAFSVGMSSENPVQAFNVTEAGKTRHEQQTDETYEWVKEKWNGVIEWFKANPAPLQFTWNLLKTAWAAAKKWLSRKLLTARTAIQSIVNNVSKGWELAKAWLKDRALNISLKIFDFLKAIKDKWTAANAFVKDKILNIALKITDFPAKIRDAWNIAHKWVKDKTINVALKITDFVKLIKDAWDAAWKWLKDRNFSLKVIVPDILALISASWNNANAWLSGKMLTAKTEVQNLLLKILDAWNAAWAWLDKKKLEAKTSVESILLKALDSWNAAWNWLTKKVLDAKTAVMSFLNPLINAWDEAMGWLRDNPLSVAVKTAVKGVIGGRTNILQGGGTAFATGGYPSPGTLFWAGENGIPEMLGTVGGRTAVASGREITGISNTILQQGSREERLLSAILSAVERKELVISPTSTLGRVVQQSNKMYRRATG